MLYFFRWLLGTREAHRITAVVVVVVIVVVVVVIVVVVVVVVVVVTLVVVMVEGFCFLSTCDNQRSASFFILLGMLAADGRGSVGKARWTVDQPNGLGGLGPTDVAIGTLALAAGVLDPFVLISDLLGDVRACLVMVSVIVGQRRWEYIRTDHTHNGA